MAYWRVKRPQRPQALPSAEEIQQFLCWLRDPVNHAEYCERYLKIQTKSAALVPFSPNPIQRKLIDKITPCLETGGKFIVLKARQIGASTGVESICYKRTTLWPDVHSLIMSNQEDTVMYLYRMFQTFHNHYPDSMREQLGSPGSAGGMNFSGIRSSLHVRTAGGKGLSTSGGTFQFAHLSEFAKWSNAEEAMLSLAPALPKSALVIIESTPYGIGNLFYQYWTDAKEKQNDFVPIFFGWFENPEYTLDKIRRGGDAYDAEPNQQQMYYVDKYGLDQQQINWMVSTIDTECGGDMDNFLQEYPFDDISCFISSGRPYFDMIALRELDLELDKSPPETVRGEFDIDGFYEDRNGNVEIYDIPEDIEIAYRYIIGGDCCEGGGGSGSDESDKKKSGDSDYNYMIVWDKVLCKQVAQSRNRYDPDLFALMLFNTMAYYGGELAKGFWPLIIVERNGPGLAVLMALKELFRKYHVPFSRLYHSGDMMTESEPTSKELGFRTQGEGEASRMAILQVVQRRIREKMSGIQSPILIGQAMTFVKNERGRPAAQEGRFDDGIMALAITFEGERLDNQPYEILKPVKLSAFQERLLKQKAKREKQTSNYRRNRYA